MYHRAKLFGAAFDLPQQEKLGEAITGTNTYYSAPMKVPDSGGNVSIQAGWTGNPTGTLTLWYTTLENPNLASDADWTEDTAFATAAADPAGSAGTTFVPGTGVNGNWMRLKYVNASGTGTLWAFGTVGR